MVYYRIRRAALLGLVAPSLVAVALVVYAVARGNAEIKDRRADRDRIDNAQTARISQLACIIASQVNEDAPGYPPDQRRIVHEYRKLYGCPPYSRARAKHPIPEPHPAVRSGGPVPALPNIGGAESDSPGPGTRTPAASRSRPQATTTRPAPTVTVTTAGPTAITSAPPAGLLPSLPLCVSVGPVRLGC